MFWHVDDTKAFNVDEIVTRTKDFVANMAQRTTSAADRVLMEQAFKHVYVILHRFYRKRLKSMGTQ